MRRSHVALLAVAAFAVALWIWIGRSPADPGATATPQRVADSSGRALADAQAAREDQSATRSVVPTAPTQVAATEATDGAVQIEIRVLRREDDTPVAGAEVGLRGTNASGPVELSGRTDADGACRLEHASSFIAHSLGVRPTATTTREGRFLDRVWVGPGAPLRETLLVSSGGSVAGRVVDLEGRPVPGARVLGWCRESFDPDAPPDRDVLADEDGRFEVGHLGAGFTLIAVSEGLACSQGLKGQLAPGARSDDGLELVLAPLVNVRGQVLGAHGQPLEARIAIQEIGFGSTQDDTHVAGVARFRPVVGEVQSDAAGRFELGPIALGPWSALVEHPDHLSQRVRVPTDGSEWIVRLEQGCGVRGSVVGSDGKPVIGAEVGLRALEDAAFREARSAEDGSFAVRGIECGDGAALMVSAPGHAPWLREGLELEPGSEPRIEVRLEPGLPLAGRVVEMDGRPLAGAYLELTGDRTWNKNYSDGQPDTWEHLFERGKSFTDEAGRFRFEDLYAGRYELRVHPPGQRTLHHKAKGTAGDEALEITLERADMERVVLEGTVVDRRTGEAVRAFRVTPMVWSSPQQATGQGHEVSDLEGRFRVAGLEPGTIELNVNAPGYATWRGGKRELDVGAHAFDVRLAALRTVEVRLLELDGLPYARRAGARFLKPTGEVVYVQNSMGSTNMVFLQGGVGRGLQLPAEPLQVAFDLQDGEPPRVFDLDLERDPSEVFEFRVERPDERTVEFGCVLVSDPIPIDDPRLAQDIRAHVDGAAHEDCLALKARVDVVASNARGAELAIGSIEPVADGFRESWDQLDRRTGSRGTSPFPILNGSVSRRATTLAIRADGYEPQTFQLAPDEENAGLPKILCLRRK